MGSSGQKRSRKGGKPRHMPKVGTATEEKYAIHHERDAVMDNMGAGPGASPVWKWTIAIIAVLLVAAAVIALVSLD
jgi:hypothetical protein